MFPDFRLTKSDPNSREVPLVLSMVEPLPKLKRELVSRISGLALLGSFVSL